jgi:hypothetical protein
MSFSKRLAKCWDSPNGYLFAAVIPFLLTFSLLRIATGWIGYLLVPTPIRRWFGDRYLGPGGLRRQPYNHWNH